MGHFYEVRAESDDLNFIMYERFKEAENDKSDPQAIKCANFYFGEPNPESFMRYVDEYCKENNIESPYNVTRASNIVEIYETVEHDTMAYLRGERNDLPGIVISFDGHECVIPIDRTEVVECFEQLKNNLVNLYYEYEIGEAEEE